MSCPVYPVVAKINANGSTDPGGSIVPRQGINTEGLVDVNIAGEEKTGEESSKIKVKVLHAHHGPQDHNNRQSGEPV